MTSDEAASFKEWMSEKMDAQNARFETSMLRAFNEHRDHDHAPLSAAITELEKDAAGDRRIARWGLAGLTGVTGLLEFLRRMFGASPPPHH